MASAVTPVLHVTIEPVTAPIDDRFDTSHLTRDLKRRTIRGGAVTLSSQGVKFVLRLGSTAILARLLTPADFGLIAMATVVTGFVEMFRDGGLMAATIQRDKITHAQVSTLFWVNVALSLAVMFTIAGLAPLIAWFYNDDRLISVTLVIAGTSIFGGTIIQHHALMHRRMEFHRLAAIEIVALLAGIITTVTMALSGFGYWALVCGSVVSAAVTSLMSFALSGWLPSFPTKQSGIISSVRFGFTLSGSAFLEYSRENLPRLVIGRLFDAFTLGLYIKAQEFLMLPLRQALPPITTVFMPILCRLQSEPASFRQVFKRLYCTALFFCCPMALVAVVNAPDLVAILLGSQWSGAIPLVQAFAFFAVSLVPVRLGALALTSLGRVETLARWNFASVLLVMATLLVASPFGIFWVAFALGAASVLLQLPALFYAMGAQTCISTSELYRMTWPFTCGALAGGAVAIAVLLPLPDSLPVARLVIGAGTAILTYVVIVSLFSRGRETIFGVWEIRHGIKSAI